MITFSQLGKLGRLGNQLFQISATIALALRNEDKYCFPQWEYEKDFNLNDCFSNIAVTKSYQEPSFVYSPVPYSQNLDLVGYFQSEKYFEDYKYLILSLLTPKVGFGIYHGTTSIHVRRGDYLNLQGCYEQLDIDYYSRAMNAVPSKQYLVFSDDIQWCKRHFPSNNVTFMEGNSPVIDLCHMLACANNIIANSSFSWWGAYLNKNPSKKIIAPSKWFGPKLTHDTKDLLPENWIRL